MLKTFKRCKQKGIISPHLFLALAIMGIIIYVLISQTFPFKDQLFSLFYPKPSSKAVGIPTTVPVLSLEYFPTKPCYAPIQRIDTSGAIATSPDPYFGPPQNAIDGNITQTKWQPVTSARGVTLQVDFGTSKTFKVITPYFYDYNQPQSYHFAVSQDGVNWTTVVTETNSLEGFTQYTSGSAIYRKNYFINPAIARYVKFVIDQYLNSDPGAAGQVNMYELEFYTDWETKQCLNFDEVGQGVYDSGIRSDPFMPDPLSDARARTQKVNLETMAYLDKGSIYHGYKDTAATPSLSYQLFERKEFQIPVPALGGYANHVKILTDLNICNYVENLGVKEVWLWMYHTAKIAPVESYQIGPNHQTGNGYMNLPVCQKSYTVYDYNLSRGTADSLEDHTHHIEHLWESLDAEAEALYQAFTNEQDEFKPNNLSLPLHCGWTHCPPNVIISPNNCNPETNVCYCEGYNWTSERTVDSDCENWKPDGTGTKTSVNCHSWDGATCVDNGGINFKVWWMQNIPGKDNSLTYNGKSLKNFWDFIGNFDAAIANGKSLTIPLPSPTPTPTIKPTPTPTPIPTPTPSPTSQPTPSPTPPAQQYGTITGTVYSSAGGTISGVKITTKIGKTNKTYYTNSLGVYSITDLPSGSYKLTFSAKGYVNQTASASVSANTTITKNVTMVKR